MREKRLISQNGSVAKHRYLVDRKHIQEPARYFFRLLLFIPHIIAPMVHFTEKVKNAVRKQGDSTLALVSTVRSTLRLTVPPSSRLAAAAQRRRLAGARRWPRAPFKGLQRIDPRLAAEANRAMAKNL